MEILADGLIGERRRQIAAELARSLSVEFGGRIDQVEIDDVIYSAVDQLSHSVHPDALPEMAFQLAHYRLENLTSSVPANAPTLARST